MYGLLVSDPTQLNPNLRFMWSTYHCESAPEPTTPAAVQQITAILTQHQPALDPAARDRIRAELMALIPWVSDCSGELLEFVLLVALQHHSLPAGERAQREARISTVLTNHFGPPAGWTPDRAATLDGVRRTAVLTPDDLLNNHLRSVCGAMETVSAQARFKPTAVLTPAETAERDAQFKSDIASAGGQPPHRGLWWAPRPLRQVNPDGSLAARTPWTSAEHGRNAARFQKRRTRRLDQRTVDRGVRSFVSRLHHSPLRCPQSGNDAAQAHG